jgi:hydrogenase expression/formation protein HypC
MCLAVPGQVKEIFEGNGVRMGRVNFGGIEKDVCLAYLPDISVGDYTIVHVGFAITKVDEEAAHKTLALFHELGILDDEFQIIDKGAVEEEDTHEVPH